MGDAIMAQDDRPGMIGATRFERRERSWTIHAGSLRFGLSTVDYRAAMIAPPSYACAPDDTPRPRRIARLAGAMLATIGAGTIVGIAVQAGSVAARPAYVVSVPLPLPAVAERVDAGEASPLARPRSEARTAARIDEAAPLPRPISRSPLRPTPGSGASPTPVVVPPAAPLTPDADAADTDAPLSSMAQAIAAASASGQLQQWSDARGLDHGFVVAGPAEGGCRSLSVLIRRPGSDDRVEQRQACRDNVAGSASPS